MPIDPADLDPDPLRQLQAWLDDAEVAGEPMPGAMALATATVDGAPSVRMVLLRGLGPDGLRFFTNRTSRKGRDLSANSSAAAVFYWAGLGRQVRVAGTVEPLSEQESTAYWATRPRGSRVAAWSSAQGAPVDSRSALEAQFSATNARFPEEPIPLPPFWGGYRLVPAVYEFWESRENRLHDRVEYLAKPSGGWRRRRLQP
jgi:pyridoxamine 5'-phosphate oxidase